MPVSIFLWKKTWNKYTQNDGAIFTVPHSRMDLDGDFMKKRLAGSYTIEAAFVMALVLWAVLFSVQAAYRLRDETVGAMALQGASEYLRHGEEITSEEAAAYAERLAGRPFSWSGYKFIIEEKRTALMGRSVSASGEGGTWSLSIHQNEYDPENFLRMCSLLNQEE